MREARRIVEEMCAGTGARVLLFGSRARGDAHAFSDIDIAIDGRGEPLPRLLCGDILERFVNDSLRRLKPLDNCWVSCLEIFNPLVWCMDNSEVLHINNRII